MTTVASLVCPQLSTSTKLATVRPVAHSTRFSPAIKQLGKAGSVAVSVHSDSGRIILIDEATDFGAIELERDDAKTLIKLLSVGLWGKAT